MRVGWMGGVTSLSPIAMKKLGTNQGVKLNNIQWSSKSKIMGKVGTGGGPQPTFLDVWFNQRLNLLNDCTSSLQSFSNEENSGSLAHKYRNSLYPINHDGRIHCTLQISGGEGPKSPPPPDLGMSTSWRMLTKQE